MPRAVLDTTILVSAFLKPVHGGASFDLLALARNSAFELYLAQAILEETARVLLASAKIRRRYAYLDADVTKYWSWLVWERLSRACHESGRFAIRPTM
jgi:predicted nucleic acid-binding protein